MASAESARGVLIIGASSPIGQAIATRFLTHGDRVIGVSRAEPPDVPPGLLHWIADCADPDTAGRVVVEARDRLERLDVVVPAAAVQPRARAVDLTTAQWGDTLAATLSSAFYVCRAALPHLPSGGSVVAVSSVVASNVSAGTAAYAAAKGGLNSLIRVLALESGTSGIRVNAVAPGLIDGAGLDNAAEGYALGRTGRTDEVANAVFFLASPEASFITGAILPVDGGLSMAQPGTWLRPDLIELLHPRARAGEEL